MMSCKRVDEFLAPYVLGSLEQRDLSRFNHHVDRCQACAQKVSEAGDTLVDLASAVPQKRVPERVKQQLLARIDRETLRQTEWLSPWLDAVRGLGNRLALHPDIPLALAVVAVLVLTGLWYSRSIQDVDDLKASLEAQMVSAVQSEEELRDMLRQQRDLTHRMATEPDLTIKTLSAAMPTVPISGDENPAGMILVSTRDTTATISAMNLPQLSTDQVYQVWLIKKGGLEITTGTFAVDSAGYGQTDINITSPLEDFIAILITIEKAGASSGRTGESILHADL